MELTLVLPDLIPPQPAGALTDVYRDLRLPELAFLLSRAHRRTLPGASLEAWLARHFGLPAEDVPAAALMLLAEHGDPGEAWWMCADPAHLEPRQDQLVLTGPETLALSRGESDELLAGLNAHFEGSGVSFHAVQPTRWYARFANPLEVRTTNLFEVIGRSINEHMPSGDDGRRLRRLMNEIQMLLHDHAVNRAREAQDRLTVNSIWPWGGGRLPVVGTRPCDFLWANDLLAQGLAIASHTPLSELPREADTLLASASRGRHWVVLDPLRTPAAEGDGHAWRRGLRLLEDKWFKPLARAFRKGNVQGLEILALGPRHTMSFVLEPRARWKFWRRIRPLGHYADAA